jgi:sporulation protein YlmC with PRC-barrel domain
MAKTTKIKDLIPDNLNFNKGTEYGNSLIEKSLRKFGAGRSILIDKNNRIIAGNKTIENAAAIGLEDLQIVESDGTKIIAVKRTDIDLDSKAGRELALADNATAKANIDWDVETTFEVAAEFDFDAGKWGVKDNEFISSFNPNVEPDTNYSDITKEQIQKEAEKLAAQMLKKRSKIECICPKCGEEFEIDG